VIRRHADYRRKLFRYVSALHAWGFRESHVIDIGNYHEVVLEMLDRIYFIVNSYDDLLDWTRPRQPWLVVDNPGVRATPPRGITAPVKPSDLVEFEKDMESIFGGDFRKTASTAWHDPDLAAEEPVTREWLEAARARLASHIVAESRQLAARLDDDEVLVLPDRIDAYRE
jgi:hypothetical protein